MDGLLKDLGVENPTPAAPVDPVDPEPETDPVLESAPADPEQDPETDPVDPEPAPTDPKAEPSAPKEDNKQAKAFAELRTKSTKYERLLKSAAEASGLELDAFMEQLETGSLNKRAEKMQTSPDILRRLEEAESKMQSYENERAQFHLAQEFNKVQTEFKISDDELTAFSQQLVSKGVNFSDPSLDMVSLYRGLNYESLLEKERQSWIELRNKGAQQGSQPIAKNGRNGTQSNTKIESEADLNALLDQMDLK